MATCQYRKLAALHGWLNGYDPGDLPMCTKPGTFSTGVVVKGEGQDVEIWTLTCDSHDRLTHSTHGYTRSMRLRAPKPDPL
jgi:hypothetical protein